MLCRARERNIRFNREKIQFWVSQVKYVGEAVSELGFSTDSEIYLQHAHSVMQTRPTKGIGHDQLYLEVYSKNVRINCTIANFA